MKLRRALEMARACEQAMHAVYSDVARLTEGGDPRLVDLWERMALVESHHAEMFEDILAALPAAAASRDVAVNPDYLRVMVDELLAFRQRLATVAVPMDEIFAFVLDMELGEQNGILLELIAQQADPAVEALLRNRGLQQKPAARNQRRRAPGTKSL